MDFPPSLAVQFTPLQELARGGFGAVWLAEQVSLGRRVAVKLLHSLADPVNRQRFQREATLTASLKHPNIVAVLDHGEAEGVPWIAYEFLDGPSVREMVAQGPMPVAEVVEIGLHVAAALEHAHARGVLHRDIKPDNIVAVTTDTDLGEQHFKVCDFGLGRGSSPDDVLTAAGILMGTPHYISPQQIQGEVPVPASDIYSLGVTLYELLAGRPPFEESNPLELLSMKLRHHAPDVRTVRPDTPAALAAIVQRTMERSRETRYATASDLWQDLDQFRQTLSDTARGERAARPSRSTGSATRPASAGRTLTSGTPRPHPTPPHPRRGLLLAGAGGMAAIFGLAFFIPFSDVSHTVVSPAPTVLPPSSEPTESIEEIGSRMERITGRIHSLELGLLFKDSVIALRNWESLRDRPRVVAEYRTILYELERLFERAHGATGEDPLWLGWRHHVTPLRDLTALMRGGVHEISSLKEAIEQSIERLAERPTARLARTMAGWLVSRGLRVTPSGTPMSADDVAALLELRSELGRIVVPSGKSATEHTLAFLCLTCQILEDIGGLGELEKTLYAGRDNAAVRDRLRRQTIPQLLDSLQERLSVLEGRGLGLQQIAEIVIHVSRALVGRGRNTARFGGGPEVRAVITQTLALAGQRPIAGLAPKENAILEKELAKLQRALANDDETSVTYPGK